MKKAIQFFCGFLTIACIGILGCVTYWHYKLPNDYQVEQGTVLHIGNTVIAQKPAFGERAVSRSLDASVGESYKQTINWLGIFPIKEVSVTIVDSRTVVLGGIPFGIKLYTDGVMVVSLSGVQTAGKTVYPAKSAGLKVGDSILSINGKSVYTNEEVAALVKESNGKVLKLRVRRNDIIFDITVHPVKSTTENCYKAGIWVRDSSAGIGTVTFYDPQTNILAGLGHAVCDIDTGQIIPISSGEIVPARIYGVTKSENGAPGELRGGFEKGSFGPLLKNCGAGVYGSLSSHTMIGQQLEILLKQEVVVGDAKIYTTVDGTKPDWYDARICQIRYRDTLGTKNMVIEITDPRLLSATGGIVQGMSGSPIIQNGKLVGAITHVFVNDPTKGYAIFAENMLETAQSVFKQQLKNAS